MKVPITGWYPISKYEDTDQLVLPVKHFRRTTRLHNIDELKLYDDDFERLIGTGFWKSWIVKPVTNLSKDENVFFVEIGEYPRLETLKARIGPTKDRKNTQLKLNL